MIDVLLPRCYRIWLNIKQQYKCWVLFKDFQYKVGFLKNDCKNVAIEKATFNCCCFFDILFIAAGSICIIYKRS